jgi:hypothetical protein
VLRVVPSSPNEGEDQRAGERAELRLQPRQREAAPADLLEQRAADKDDQQEPSPTSGLGFGQGVFACPPTLASPAIPEFESYRRTCAPSRNDDPLDVSGFMESMV